MATADQIVRLIDQMVLGPWKRDWLRRSINEIRLNLTGRVLRVRTGNLRDSILPNSRETEDGFAVGTNVDYGIYWEGTPSGLTDMQAFERTGGAGRRARGIRRSRPFIRPVIEQFDGKMLTDLEQRLDRLGESMPGIEIEVGR